MTKQKAVLLLVMLLILFTFRVLAQLLQFGLDMSWLPTFNAWHSATVPYGWLLLSQFVIISIIITVIIKIQRQTYAFKKTRAMILLWLGATYFFIMLVRLIIGFTIMPDHPWFGATLPALFHLVLASIFFVIGIYEQHGYQQTFGKSSNIS